MLNNNLYREVYNNLIELGIKTIKLDIKSIQAYDYSQIRAGPEYYYKTINEMVLGEDITSAGLYKVENISISGNYENYSISIVKNIKIKE